jgi:Protein of unknown function (DUF3568)
MKHPAAFSFRARTAPALALAACVACNAGCAPVAVTLLGAGAGFGLNREMSGYASRTFSQPMPKVRNALLIALRRMSIRLDKVAAEGTTETLKAMAGTHTVGIEIEPLTDKATRIRAVVRKDLLSIDPATAQEIIAQTELVLTRG